MVDYREDLILFLRLFWRAADWKRIGRKHYAGDIFQHRVRVAADQPSFRRAAEKLAKTLSLQYPPAPPELIDRLDESPTALQSLRKESRYWVALAVARRIETSKQEEEEPDADDTQDLQGTLFDGTPPRGE